MSIYEPDDVLFDQLRAVYATAGRGVRRVQSAEELVAVARGTRAGVASVRDDAGVVVQDCETVHIHYHYPETDFK